MKHCVLVRANPHLLHSLTCEEVARLIPIAPSLLEKSSVVHVFVYRYTELFPTRQLILHFPCCAGVPVGHTSPNATKRGKG